MNDSRFLPDDSKLTAYVLGELDPAEAVAVEAALQSDPVARDTVASIRAMTTRLEVALRHEAAVTEPAPPPVVAPPPREPFDYHQPKKQGWAKMVRFPQCYYVISGAAAAVFALMALWQKPRYDEKVRGESIYWQLAQERRARAITEAQNEALRERLALLETQNGGTTEAASPVADAVMSARVTFSAGPALAPASVPANTIGADLDLPLPSPPKRRATAAPTEADAFQRYNEFLGARQYPHSTFPIDVDTASYASVRRYLLGGRLPPGDAVRIEEMVNYFPYRYPAPASTGRNREPAAPFAVSMEVSEAPWAPAHRLVRIGLKGREVTTEAPPAANLAEKLPVEQVNGTLVTIAKDVRIQVEFNPARVASYRLIGFENRPLAKEDFSHDPADAGEIGAGHMVTALYEIVPARVKEDTRDPSAIDDLKYQGQPVSPKLPPEVAAELLTVKVRYKEPTANESRKLEFPLTDSGGRFWAASADLKFATAVAQFGMQLRNSPHKGVATMANVVEWAIAGAADDPGGFRREFIDLVRRAEGLVQ